ncbi:MAG: JAB domain-containing protein [Geminicoccaceae bacterium]
MHSAVNQEKTDASHQKRHSAHDQIAVDDLHAQAGEAVSASWLSGRRDWPNRELNRIISTLGSLDVDVFKPADYLELLLYLSSGRPDTRSLAESMLAFYGSLAKILTRSGEELRERFALDYGMTAQLALAKLTQKFIVLPDLASREKVLSASDILTYAASNMRGSEEEVLHVVYLDQKFGIIRDQEMARGTVDTVAIYPREIAKRALAYCASSVILIHNHLSDDPTPSQSDIVCTRKVKTALDALDIVLHDHLIVSRSRHLSMSQEGFL